MSDAKTRMRTKAGVGGELLEAGIYFFVSSFVRNRSVRNFQFTITSPSTALATGVPI